MPAENPSFSGINYNICLYCKYLVYAETRDETIFGCGLIQDSEGQYQSLGYKVLEIPEIKAGKITEIVRFEDPKVKIDLREGCVLFDTSGLPAHPVAREVMVESNPLAVSIPEDPSALETSWDLDYKMRGFNSNKLSDYRKIG
jgi:hypothetical protein